MIEIDPLVDGIEALPPSPYPLPELFKALSDPNADLSRIVEIISFEPALTSKLLQICNSAFFSRGRPANNIAEAVNRLGFQTVYRAVAAIKSPQIFSSVRNNYGINAHAIWKHSAVAALAAQIMAEDFAEDSGVLFTAALLHDVGKVILAEKYKEEYSKALSQAREQNQALHEIEKRIFGMDHAIVGARLLERWSFSGEMVASVRFHHHPRQAGGRERFAAMVQVASALSHARHPEPEGSALPCEAHAGLEIFGWTQTDLENYAKRLDKNMPLLNAMMLAI